MESQGKTPQEIQKAIVQFAVKYGLLGLMTALPTTPTFMDYEVVYLPKSHFIKEKPCPPRTIFIYSFRLTIRM